MPVLFLRAAGRAAAPAWTSGGCCEAHGSKPAGLLIVGHYFLENNDDKRLLFVKMHNNCKKMVKKAKNRKWSYPHAKIGQKRSF